MSESAQLILLAEYNEWMNDKLYAAARHLGVEELVAPRGAFFGSIIATLNHIVVGDTIWLQRFATHPAHFFALQDVLAWPAPASLTAIHSADLDTLFAHRQKLDGIIRQWADTLTEADLAHVLRYANTKGVVSHKRFGSLVLHFFNHQTHHRGQASTLLSQAGVDIGVTDLLVLIPNQPA